MAKIKKGSFRFRNSDFVGAPSAEEDEEFLRDCFIDAGDLPPLLDCQNPGRIIVGRTGAGKTALLLQLRASVERCIVLEPDALSLQYLSNNTIIRYLSGQNVDLDLFYRLLWRHIFAVELIKSRYSISSDKEQRTFIDQIVPRFFKNKAKEKALAYLTEWGTTFFETTEYRVREVTKKLEEEVKASIKGKVPHFESILEGKQVGGETERLEIVARAQDVVHQIQIKTLNDLIQLLAEDIFSDPQQRYYVLIDRLDERWVDDEIRYRLIRALVETIRDFQRVRNVKIVIALRRDLLDRVVRLTRDSGFQEEKYQGLYLNLKWSRSGLLRVLDTRVNKLIRSRYTGQQVSYRDILPQKVGKMSIDDYLIQRTLYRPRDIIAFFNICIGKAQDKAEISPKMLREAEGEHSRMRLRSLADEWHADYPELVHASSLLKRRTASFRIGSITTPEIKHLCLEIAAQFSSSDTAISRQATAVFEDKLDPISMLCSLVYVFYRTGLIGLKLDSFSAPTFAYFGEVEVSEPEVGPDTGAVISPVFFRTLGVLSKEESADAFAPVGAT